jgi:hypothetical protein
MRGEKDTLFQSVFAKLQTEEMVPCQVQILCFDLIHYLAAAENFQLNVEFLARVFLCNKAPILQTNPKKDS